MKSINVFLRQVVCVVAGLLIASPAQAALSPLLTKGPYLQAPGTTTMTILWESLTNVPGVVHFGIAGATHTAVTAAPPREMKGVSSVKSTNVVTRWKTNVVEGRAEITPALKTNVVTLSATNLFYVYEVSLTNLAPGTTYSYSVESGGHQTASRSFSTFGKAAESVRFIAYGDTRSLPQIHAAIAKRFMEFKPEFILHTGDLVAKGKDYGLWSREFFTPLADVIDRVPLLPAIGNHEEDATNYLAYFHLPPPERWYSFDHGPVHVLALDYHFERPTNAAGRAQLEFATRDLQSSDAPWKVVFVHYPMFNIGGHGSAWGHEVYLPLFRDTKVDLVLSGHSHLYERFRPLTSSASSWPMTHITTGGGAANLAPSHPHPALAVHGSTNHFIVFQATADRLSGTTILTSGGVFDQFVLTKSGGTLTRDWLARRYPEEWLQGSFDLGKNLAARLTGPPATNEPAHVLFNIAPLKRVTGPAEVEITLMQESRKYYVMEPVRFAAPLRGEEARTVWATVRSTDRREIKADKKTKELSPALRFTARAIGTSAETVAYGGNCRVSATAAEAWKALQVSEATAANK